MNIANTTANLSKAAMNRFSLLDKFRKSSSNNLSIKWRACFHDRNKRHMKIEQLSHSSRYETEENQRTLLDVGGLVMVDYYKTAVSSQTARKLAF